MSLNQINNKVRKISEFQIFEIKLIYRAQFIIDTSKDCSMPTQKQILDEMENVILFYR